MLYMLCGTVQYIQYMDLSATVSIVESTFFFSWVYFRRLRIRSVLTCRLLCEPAGNDAMPRDDGAIMAYSLVLVPYTVPPSTDGCRPMHAGRNHDASVDSAAKVHYYRSDHALI